MRVHLGGALLVHISQVAEVVKDVGEVVAVEEVVRLKEKVLLHPELATRREIEGYIFLKRN